MDEGDYNFIALRKDGNYEREDSQKTIKIFNEMNADVVIVDGYTFTDEWEKDLVENGIRLIAIDDEPLRKHSAECVICPGPWSGDNGIQTLYGESKYVGGANMGLVKDEYKTIQRKVEKGKWLICMSGSDCHELLIKILQGLKISNLEIRECIVICSQKDKENGELKELADKNEWIKLELMKRSLRSLYESVEYTIGGCGVMALERRECNIPSVSVELSQNQHYIAQLLEKEKEGEVIKIEDELDELVAEKVKLTKKAFGKNK